MNYVNLVKLISSVERIESRRQLQAVNFLYKQNGHVVFGDNFHLNYGIPYSHNLADILDRLVQQRHIKEKIHNNRIWGKRYSYRITNRGRKLLAKNEKDITLSDNDIFRFRQLVATDLWELELATTMSYFYIYKDMTWEQARDKTIGFKQMKPVALIMDRAEKIAKEYTIT